MTPGRPHSALVQKAIALRAVFMKPIDGNVPHAFAIVTPPQHQSGRFVIVNWTTRYGTRFEDSSCLLSSGDHEWVKHDSYIYYTGAELRTVADLRTELMAFKSLRVADTQLSDVLYKRILAGFLNTSECPTDVHAFLLSLLSKKT